MTYTVIKTIKGKRYAYQQRSYREGNKVKTISQYIGAVDNDGVIHETLEAPELALSQQAPQFNLNTRTYKISQDRYTAEYQHKLHTLIDMKIDPATFPRFEVKGKGEIYTYHKAAFQNKMVVLAPKYGGNRETLRKTYREALHRAFIETLAREAPEALHPFQYAFDTAYRKTQDALTTYLMNCNSKDNFIRVMAVQWFGYINPVKTGKKSTLNPEQLGLVAYGDRKDWKQEYSTLMASIDKRGLTALKQQAHNEIAKASRMQQLHIKKKTIFWIRRIKAIRRQQAKIDANHQLLHKLALIEAYFPHLIRRS